MMQFNTFVVGFDAFVCGLNLAITVYEIEYNFRMPWLNFIIGLAGGVAAFLIGAGYVQ